MARPIEKREQIEKAVIDVVARKGLPATTIQDIATAAGVSQGLLYRYWENRDDLAGDAYRKQFQGLMAGLARHADSKAGVLAQLDHLIEGFYTFADTHPTELAFILLSQHQLHNRVSDQQGLFALVEPLFHAGMANGELRSMNPVLAIQIGLGIVMQPVISTIYGHLARPVFQYKDEVCQALRRGLAR